MPRVTVVSVPTNCLRCTATMTKSIVVSRFPLYVKIRGQLTLASGREHCSPVSTSQSNLDRECSQNNFEIRIHSCGLNIYYLAEINSSRRMIDYRSGKSHLAVVRNSSYPLLKPCTNTIAKSIKAY